MDAVLYLEGSGRGDGETESIRILRAAKNRFGSSSEVGVYSMNTAAGITGGGGRLVPITDPSSLFLSTRMDDEDVVGCAVSVVLEGLRPMTVEVQALASDIVGGAGSYGRRVVDGINMSEIAHELVDLSSCLPGSIISFSRHFLHPHPLLPVPPLHLDLRPQVGFFSSSPCYKNGIVLDSIGKMSMSTWLAVCRSEKNRSEGTGKQAIWTCQWRSHSCHLSQIFRLEVILHSAGRWVCWGSFEASQESTRE